jgi:hypothetical protein
MDAPCAVFVRQAAALGGFLAFGAVAAARDLQGGG